MSFNNFNYLYILFLIPFLFLIIYVVFRKKWHGIFSFIRKENLLDLAPLINKKNIILRITLLFISLIFFIITIARPQYGFEEEKINNNLNLIFVLDVSTSMLCKDVVPSRLDLAKISISKIIEEFKASKIGLVAFSHTAVLASPLTFDHEIIKMYVQAMDEDFLSSGGTAISSGIMLASDKFDRRENSVLVIVSDGEDHGLITNDFKNKIKDLNIFALVVGTESGAPVPIYKNGNIESYIKDEKGEIVISKSNLSFFKNFISEDKIFKINDLTSLENSLSKISTSKGEEKKQVKKERYQIPLLISFLTLFLGIIL